jgi:hypothetical protein
LQGGKNGLRAERLKKCDDEDLRLAHGSLPGARAYRFGREEPPIARRVRERRSMARRAQEARVPRQELLRHYERVARKLLKVVIPNRVSRGNAAPPRPARRQARAVGGSGSRGDSPQTGATSPAAR